MYARVTSYQADPSRLDAMASKLEELKLKVKALTGILDVYSLWREDGQGVIMAIYNSQEEAESAMPEIQAFWSELDDFLTSSPQTETYGNIMHLTT